MTMQFLFRCFAGALFLFSAQAASAQQQAPQTPSQVLSQFPSGGADMEAQIQSLLNANRGNLGAIIDFAKTATNDQRKSIASALATFAKAIAANEPGYVTQLQQAVANAGLPEFAKAYAEAAGDTGTASAGGGGGGGGPTAVGPPTGGPNTGAILPASTFVATQSLGLTGVPGLGGITPVSPTQ